jgi:nitronate monooxygenase
MTIESPVAPRTLERYLATRDPTQIRVTTAVDGLPQRFVENAEIRRLEGMGAPARLAAGARHALVWGRTAGLSVRQMATLAWRSVTADGSGFAATVMAPNLPRLVERGLVDGDVEGGLMPSGQVAALIDRLESVETVIARIVADAAARIEALAGRSSPADPAPDAAAEVLR